MIATANSSTLSSRFEIAALGQWLTWLVLMSVVIGAFIAAALSSGARSVELGMYAVIVLPGLGLLAKGFLDARFLDKETRLASMQVRILEEVNDFDEFFRRADDSVCRRHFENLYLIALAQAEVSQDALVEILHSRLAARNRIVELFASILITLGLIGTIVGLIYMMEGMGTVMAEGSGELLQRLANPATGPLRGMATAFYTTLLGATLGGVLLRVLASIVEANIVHYTAHLAELTEVHVLPPLRLLAKQAEKARERSSGKA